MTLRRICHLLTSTKWNRLLVSHAFSRKHLEIKLRCIGVDPYYLTFKAEELGYHPEVILSGRRINDGMGKFVAENTVKKMIRAGKAVKGAKVLILGLTFKENVGDIRNTKVVDIISELAEYDVESYIYDPYANAEEVRHEYGLEIYPQEVGYAQPPQDRGGWASLHSKNCRRLMRWCWRFRMISSKI